MRLVWRALKLIQLQGNRETPGCNLSNQLLLLIVFDIRIICKNSY